MKATKTALIGDLIAARQRVLDEAACLSPDQQKVTSLGSWSVLDLLAHLAGWDAANLEGVQAILDNRLPEFYAYQDRDWHTFNARLVETYRRPDYPAMRALVEASHRALAEFLQALPEDEFFKDRGLRFRGYRVLVGRLLMAEAKDEHEHARQVFRFRQQVTPPEPGGRFVELPDTHLYIAERGQGYPVLILHGGPGLDHHSFGPYLDPLAEGYRLILVDQRGQGRSESADPASLTLAQMAQDVVSLAEALGLERYAVLGHSFGALVALQNAVAFPGRAAQTIVSSGFPSARFLELVDANLERFEPVSLRAQVKASWARESTVRTPEEVGALLHDQNPFHFKNPFDPRLPEYERATAGSCYSPSVLRHFASQEYGGIEVEDRLGEVPQPVLVFAGRYDRTCPVEASQAIARGIPQAELVIFENSAHMTFVEENQAYLAAVRAFLERHLHRPGETV